MSGDTMRVLLIGYGNPGRGDDGLGPALAEAVEKMGLPDLTVDSNYQLNVEDSEHLAQHDVVIFADASVNGAEPFFFESLVPDPSTGFSSHSVEPQALLALAWQLFGATTRGWVLGIRGYEFNEFCEELSDPARRNLQMAVEFVRKIMQDRELFKKESNLN